jgi:hypothetical protein
LEEISNGKGKLAVASEEGQGSRRADEPMMMMMMKIRCTTSFGGEVKPSAPYRKILRHAKDPISMKVILVGKFH